jgi:hypothetical protein
MHKKYDAKSLDPYSGIQIIYSCTFICPRGCAGVLTVVSITIAQYFIMARTTRPENNDYNIYTHRHVLILYSRYDFKISIGTLRDKTSDPHNSSMQFNII